MKMAIIHDWLTVRSGAERILEQIIKCYPDADLFSMVDFLPKSSREFLLGKPVRTSLIQKLPFAKTHYRKYLPLMPFAVERLDFSAYDIVISGSHAVAKGILTSPDQLHVCYLMARNLKYAYEDRNFYPGGNLVKFVEDVFLHYLRIWDFSASKRPDVVIAPSRYVSRWHKRMHGVEPSVIYPPVDVEFFSRFFREDKDEYYVVAARLEPYKRTDIIVRAFSEMGKKLLVFGDGTELRYLKSIAGPSVIFKGFQGKETIAPAVAQAKAFIFSGREDFGIAMVEAQACGTPVIALGKGGALESIRGLDCEHPTGLFFGEQSPASLISAVREFEARVDRLTPEACRENALKYSEETFRLHFSEVVGRAIDAWRIQTQYNSERS